MTDIVFDDFNDGSDGDEIQNRGNWEVVAAVNNLDALTINASGSVGNSSGNAGALARQETNSTDHFAEAKLAITPTATTYYGAAICAETMNDLITVRYQILSGFLVYQVGYRSDNGTAWTGLKTFTVALGNTQPSVGYRHRLETDNNILKFYVDDGAGGDFVLQNPSNVAIPARFQGRTQAGFWCALTANALLDDVRVGSLGTPDSIFIDNTTANQIIPVIGSTYTETLSGTYTGFPTAIDARFILDDNTTVIVDWTEIDSSPSGGVYSETIEVPLTLYGHWEVRHSNAPSITGSGARRGYGKGGEAGGQSNLNGWFSGTDAETPNSNTAVFDGSNWLTPSGQSTAVLNALQLEHNCCVFFMQTTVSGTAIANHIAGGNNYQARVDALTAVGGKLNFFLWGQGETVSTGYLADLTTLHTDIITRTGQSSSTIPMFIIQLGRETGTLNAVTWNQTRQDQTTFANTTSDVYISHQTMDLPMSDTVHRDASGSLQEALRFVDTYLFFQGSKSYSGRGPIVTSASSSGNVVTISHDLNGSTSITVPTDAEDLYEVTEDDFSSTVAVSSISSPTIDTIQLTLASSISGTPKLRTHQGREPVVSKFPLGTVLYDSQAVMVEPVVTEMSISATAVIKPLSTGRFNSAAIFNPASPPDVTPEQALEQQDGELFRINWSDITSADGVYDLSPIQDALDEAVVYGKQLSLIVVDSKSAPQYVKDAVGTDLLTYDFTNNGTTTTETTPIPWNTQYLAFKQQMITSLGSFDSHPNLRAIYFTYSAMTNGAEFHFRLKASELSAYTLLGYTPAVQSQAARDILDMYRLAFPTTHIAAEAHVIFSDSGSAYQDLYDHGFATMPERMTIALWWAASRIALDISGNESEAPIWPIVQAAQLQGTEVICQFIGNFTTTPERFEYSEGEGLTSSQTFIREMTYWYGEGVRTFEIWEQDIKDNGGTLLELMLYDSNSPIDISEPQFSSSVLVTTDDITTSVSFNLIEPTFSSVVTNLVPNVDSAVSLSPLGPVFSSGVLIDLPEEVTLGVSFSGLQPLFSSTLDVIVPENLSSVFFQGISPTFNVSSTVEVPINTLSVVLSGLQPLFSSSFGIVIPEYTASISFEGTDPSFSVVVVDTAPSEVSSSISFVGLDPVFNSSTNVTIPEYLASVGFQGLQPVFSSSATVTGIGEVVSSVGFQITEPIFSAGITLSTPEYLISVDFSTLTPTFSVTIDQGILNNDSLVSFEPLQPQFNSDVNLSIPEYTLSASFNGLQPLFSCTLNTGQLDFVLIEFNNINLPSLSRNINLNIS